MVDSGLIRDRFRGDSGSTQGRFRVDSGSIWGRLGVDSGSIRRYSTLFDVIRRYSTLFNVKFDAIRRYFGSHIFKIGSHNRPCKNLEWSTYG